ncbi:MAG: RagB/SusD family nutrient uptake outer membrane protein [Tannerellaceae bacterium]|jgi:hypothetical protein|nr:RagB/SusD family nutrient uptake outer membrane protein [Tannerellaceae bacterium]
MKNKYMKAIISATTLLFIATSCGEDFLYKAPQGSIDDAALANEQGVDLLVTNAYANLSENGWGASVFNWALGGIYGGDANKGSDAGDQSVLNSLETYALLTTNSYVSEKWDWIYKGSKRVAMAFKALNNTTDIDPAIATSRKGELHFLRAMFYYEGLKVFGPYIPYIDESHQENDPKVHNDKDIYNDVLADADKAIANLPNTQSEPGRVNAYAAKMLKAKILLQKGDYAAAKPIIKDVLDNGVTSFGKKYGLADDMSANWDSFRDNTSPESIWEIQFSADGPNDNGNAGMSLCYPHNTGPGGCCGFYQPSFELANSFKVNEDGLPYLNGEYRSGESVSYNASTNGTEIVSNTTIAVDPRLDFSIGRIGIPYKDHGLADQGWIRDANNGGFFIPKKHVYSKAEADAGLGRSGMYAGWAPGSAMNIQYLSVRDAMLLYAECLANDGELAPAMDLVNKIRTRAGNEVNIIKNEDGTPASNYKVSTYSAAHSAFTDKATCIKAIRMERKLELAMEGVRFFDLNRWGGEYMAKELGDYVDYEKKYISKFAGAAHLAANKTMFPIPQTQIQTMGNDESGQPFLVQPAPWK